MIRCRLFEYVDGSRRAFHEWLRGLEKRTRGKLDSRLDLIEQNGVAEYEESWCPSLGKGIHKIVVNGDVAVRPRLCKGPISNDSEATLLLGVNKKDNIEYPGAATEQAAALRNEVEDDPDGKRRDYERIGNKTPRRTD